MNFIYVEKISETILNNGKKYYNYLYYITKEKNFNYKDLENKDKEHFCFSREPGKSISHNTPPTNVSLIGNVFINVSGLNLTNYKLIKFTVDNNNIIISHEILEK